MDEKAQHGVHMHVAWGMDLPHSMDVFKLGEVWNVSYDCWFAMLL